MRRRTRTAGMTLIEMLAAITVLMILTAILAEVFFQATKAATQGKAVCEVYQVSRALRTVLAKDLSGVTADYFESHENGLIAPVSAVYGLPPGPFHSAMSVLPPFAAPGPGPADMRRMLAGGSDYLVMTSASASSSDKSVAKIYYVLRDTGQLIRVSHADNVFTNMDYLLDAIDHGVDNTSAPAVDTYEETRVIAQNVSRVKFSFLSKNMGPISQSGLEYANGIWLDNWDWNSRPYLPAAVKVQLQLVDHLWNTADDDRLTNRNFDPIGTDANNDALRPSEMFDPDDGEPFTFIIDLPLAMR